MGSASGGDAPGAAWRANAAAYPERRRLAYLDPPEIELRSLYASGTACTMRRRGHVACSGGRGGLVAGVVHAQRTVAGAHRVRPGGSDHLACGGRFPMGCSTTISRTREDLLASALLAHVGAVMSATPRLPEPGTAVTRPRCSASSDRARRPARRSCPTNCPTQQPSTWPDTDRAQRTVMFPQLTDLLSGSRGGKRSC
jgi:hypothetical protein